MKTKYVIGCVLTASLLSTSCSDFLQEDPKGKLTKENFFKTEAQFNSGVWALYEKVQQSQTYTNMLYPQWQGDDMTANPGSNKQAVAELDAFSSTSNNKGVKDAWTRNFAIIRAANLFLNDAKDASIKQEVKNIGFGQAYFWRANSYFYLVRLFGPLPLLTTPSDDNNIPLSTEEDVYTQILKDLDEAEKLVAVSYSGNPQSIGGTDNYVTKNAVRATKAAVYMAMAGYPLNKGNEYYKKAAAEAKKVIDNKADNAYQLEEDWRQIYSMGNNWSKETVLGIANSPQNGSWNHDSEFTSCCRFEGLGDGGWGDVWGEIKFWKNYPEGPRKNVVYAPKITFETTTTTYKINEFGVKVVDSKSYSISKTVDWWALKNDTAWKDSKNKSLGYDSIKYDVPIVPAHHPMFAIFTQNADEKGNAINAPYDYTKINYRGMTNGHRHRLIRYSEVLLWYAECLARTGGDQTEAKQLLKQVHNRAVDDKSGMFTYMDGTKIDIDAMNADQLAQACVEEHGWEVAGYWLATVTRRADEFRLGQLDKNFNYRKANVPLEVAQDSERTYKAKEAVEIKNKAWDGLKTIYLPYPDTEVEKNPNLIRK